MSLPRSLSGQTNSSTAAGMLWHGAAAHPDRPCVTELDRQEGPVTLSYGQLLEHVAELAGGLDAAGVGRGDRVALLMRNRIEFVVAFFGVAARGAVVVPLNARLQEGELTHMLADSGSTLLITEDHFLTSCRGLAAIDGLKVHSVTAAGLEALCGPAIAAPAEPAPSGLLSLMYTSGTTGLPKAVMLSHSAWDSVSRTAGRVLGVSREDAVLHVAPLTHGAGFMLLPTLAAGGHNLLCHSYDPARTAALIDDGTVTGMFLVPSMIRMLLDARPDGWRAPPSYRWLYYAGSPIDRGTLYEAARAFEGRITQSFAQMESPMFLTVLDAADHARILADPTSGIAGSAGRLLPGVELAVVDPDGESVPVGETGEIIARAPQMMAGYWNRVEESALALAGGWLHTGDVGHLDAEGYLYVVDRLKDMIITGGSNVYAREVEEVLVGISGVQEAAVFGIPDRLWGEAVTAVLVPADENLDTDAVVAACKEALPGYRVPKRIYLARELPRNSYGKVLKRELRKAYARLS